MKLWSVRWYSVDITSVNLTMCRQRKPTVKDYFHGAVICRISKAFWPGLSSWEHEPNWCILTQFGCLLGPNQKPGYLDNKNTKLILWVNVVTIFTVMFAHWGPAVINEPNTLDNTKDVHMPQSVTYHLSTMCVDTHTCAYTMTSRSCINWSPVRELSALPDALQMELVVMWALLTGAVKMQWAATQWEHLTIQLDT